MSNRERYPLPLLKSTDYASFRALPGSDLPADFEAWQADHVKEKIARGRIGYDVVEVEIDVAPFVRYCDQRQLRYIGDSLLKFAFETSKAA